MFMFEIHGVPVPQQQTRFLKKSGIMYDPSKKDRRHIEWQARPYAPKDPLLGPILLELSFYFPVLASVSKVMRRQMLNHIIHHTKKPDADNCAYLVTNSLKGIFYRDDSQIIDLIIHKRYGEIPRTVVRVMEIEQIVPTQGVPCE